MAQPSSEPGASTPDSPPLPPREFAPLAAVLAWLLPGLGHIVLGERRRGVFIMIGVLFLVAVGVLVGGVDAVDRKNDRLWFLAQGLCGPVVLAVDLVNQTVVQPDVVDWSRRTDLWDEFLAGDPEIISSLRRVGTGRVNEMGTLFVALAGLMNLVVILDALHFQPRPQERRQVTS